MNNENLPGCDACGSSRVASGKLAGGEDARIWFEFSETNGRYWRTISNVPSAVSVSQNAVKMCLDCGKVTASMSVDVKEAARVLSQWGSDGLKSRLAS